MRESLPFVGITMGDPAGIGPEIVCKSLADKNLYEQCRPVVIGTSEVMARALAAISSKQKIGVIQHPAEGRFDEETVNVIHLPLGYEYEPGVMKAENGRVSIDYIKKSHEMLLNKEIMAVACAPCNKEAMKLSGSPYTGATELYGHLCGDLRTFTVVEQGGCYIFQLTTHLSLRDALEQLAIDKVADTLVVAYRALLDWGIQNPRLALSGLNPHAGDGGVLGREEIEILSPAIKKAGEKTGEIYGPVPADSIYIKGMDGEYDGIVFLFHDTANIPIKLMDKIHPSVVITGGLPYVRTTVAHGTAYDIAYRGTAGNRQMLNAILAAAQIGKRIADKE